MNKLPEWLDDAVFYEIYPQSFQDSNGDGIGDIPGMIARLDYIKNLGCNAVWVNPWYDSPFGDAGYDVRDYKKIAPRYGTNEDARCFFHEAHKRGMHVLIDLVPGHTSVEHPWFRASMEPKRNEFSDRYIWTDTIWESTDLPCLRGVSQRDGSVAVNFFTNQPALNYGYAKRTRPWMMAPDSEAALATREAIKDVMRFWLDMGADGFRVDMAASLVKADEEWTETIKLWQDFRAFLDDEYPHAALISEWGVPAKAIEGGFHMDFLLQFPGEIYSSLFRCEHPFFSGEGKGDIMRFLEPYLEHLSAVNGRGLICIPSGNHDTPRLSRSRDTRDLKICFTFLFTVGGAPFLYYGDEIGMRYLEWLTSVEGGYDRTGSRSPMQWEKKEGFGFTEGNTPYIPFDNSPSAPTVEESESDENSLLHAVKELLAVRHAHPALHASGTFRPVFAKKKTYPFAYVRKGGGEEVLVVLNPANKAAELPFDCTGEMLYYVGGVPENNTIPARSACIVKKIAKKKN